MKKNEIEVGGNYLAKVGARSLEVRIIGENAKGGWNATSVANGKPVRVKDVRHLKPAKAAAGAPAEPASEALVADEAEAGGTAADVDPAPPTKPAKRLGREAKATPETAPKRMSCLDAAAQVLKDGGQPMQCKSMVEAMAAKGLWTTTAPTPAATLYSAILRDLTAKGDASRFRKTDRGHFALKE